MPHIAPDTHTHDPVSTARSVWSAWIAGRAWSDVDVYPVINPATGAELARVTRCRSPGVDAAVEAASRALPAWAALPVARRRDLLEHAAGAVRDRTEELARLETLNNGKPISDARRDIEKSAEALAFYGSLADKLFGTTIPTSPGYLTYTLQEPIGVTAHISPWNYPLRLALRSVAPALAAGNTVVLKPAEQTPLTAIRFAEILTEVGFPAGVVNVVPGFGTEAGAPLVSHPGVAHVSFTGSVETGIEVMQRAAPQVTPVTLELGGKSPNIVFADADLDLALAGTITAAFSNAGQVCCAGSRLLLDAKIYDTFLDRLVTRTNQITLGPGLDDPDMGPLISSDQRQRVLDYIEVGRAEGGEVLSGGSTPKPGACEHGYFVEPTLVTNVSNRARVAQEEIFGPVLTVLRFRTPDEAIALANDNPYGLVAGVWTSNLDRAHRLAAHIQAGQVYVNDFFSGSVASPFGGYKRSGFGRERGVEALRHYVQIKSVCVRYQVDR